MQEATFVGLDLQNCQPDLRRPEYGLQHIASRIDWVHEDFLEPLPFDAEVFDYVRFGNVGLAVPEDEWQSLLEECARVLVPGGVIEVIEDDLIFPSGRSPKENDSKSSVGSSTVLYDDVYGGSTSSLSYTSTTSTYSSDRELLAAPPVNTSSSMDSTSSAESSSPSASGNGRFQNPHDHSKLMRAWHGMLDSRFITPSIISVLPFYLSAFFQDIQMMPTVHILLPPNTHQLTEGLLDSRFQFGDAGPGELYLDLKTDGTRWSTDRADNPAARSKQQSKSATVSSRASIHLAKSVQMVRACKNAIRQVYLEEKGYGTEREENLIREEFETAWANWESDMKDRMSMRAKLNETLAWVDTSSGERPNWRVWREQAGEVSESASSYIGPENLCRSIRGFVGYKPKIPAART